MTPGVAVPQDFLKVFLESEFGVYRSTVILTLHPFGGDSYLRSDFLEGKVRKIFNFALKIKGDGREGGTCEVLRSCHPPQNLERAQGNNFVPMQSRYCSGEGQHRIGKYFLDGYRVLPCGSRECYEFYGCYYHGCSICFPDRSKVVRCKYRENGYTTIEKAYMNTIERERLIRHTMNFDSSVDKWIVLWEHEYNEKFEIFKDKLGDMIHDFPRKMNPRDAVKGGRTEVFRMHVNVKNPNKQ